MIFLTKTKISEDLVLAAVTNSLIHRERRAFKHITNLYMTLRLQLWLNCSYKSHMN